jgi:hypothetical protein
VECVFDTFHTMMIRWPDPLPARQNLNERPVHAMATLMLFDLCWLDQTTAVGAFLQGRSTEFDARFSRCHGLLQFVMPSS